jgi:hypothetical protein
MFIISDRICGDGPSDSLGGGGSAHEGVVLVGGWVGFTCASKLCLSAAEQVSRTSEGVVLVGEEAGSAQGFCWAVMRSS